MQTENTAAAATAGATTASTSTGKPARNRGGGTLSARTGASRKLLERKAAEKVAGADPFGPGLEDSFPGAGDADAGEPGGELAQADAVASDADAAGAIAQVEDAGAEQANATPDTSGQPAAAEPATVDIEPALSAPAAAPLAPESAPSDPVAADPAPAPTPAPAWSEADEATLNALLARRRAAGFQRRGRDVSGQLLRVGAVQPNSGTVVATIVALVAERGVVARADLLDAMAGAAFAHPKARPGDRGWCQGYVAGAVKDGYLAFGDTADAAPSDPAAVGSEAAR